jgi:hypothetical protein
VLIDKERHKDTLKSRVVSFDNFISPSDCLELYEFCKNNKEWPRDFYERGELPRVNEPPRPHHELADKYIGLGIKEISYFFTREMQLLYPAVLRKYSDGESLGVHCDGVSLDDAGDSIDYLRDYDPTSVHPTTITEGAMVLYLNDDYDGGELFFPDIDLEIKPKSGQLIAWPSGPFFEHGVKKISNGDRYVVSSFLTTPKLALLHDKIRLTHITQ